MALSDDINFQANSLIDLSNSVSNNTFVAATPPTASGFASRQARVPNNRIGAYTRNMVRWLVPDSGVVEMFINPNNIKYNYAKQITQQRTKGGYVLQYWGERLTTLNINGTTGSSGIEGINVLFDVYRAEQLAYDAYALSLEAQQQNQSSLDNSSSGILQVVGDVADILSSGISTPMVEKPSLAQFAFGIEMYYHGWVFRGYFENFDLTESADRVGLYDYSMAFVVTQRRGFRLNSFGWQRSAVNGPSDTSLIGGNPLSYVNVANGFSVPTTQATASQIGTLTPNLQGNSFLLGQ